MQRSPTATPLAFGPTALTVPKISCPSVSGSDMPISLTGIFSPPKSSQPSQK